MEVVSPSSVMKDYIRKNAKYNEAGVREYWIVDPVKKTVVTYDFTTDGYPAVHSLEGKVGVAIFNYDLEIDFDEYKELLGE